MLSWTCGARPQLLHAMTACLATIALHSFGPSEALGFSGRFVRSWRSGPPRFEEQDFDFDFNGKPTTLQVHVR